jgi:putative Mg2+ transporter-C (MgtC) family protein
MSFLSEIIKSTDITTGTTLLRLGLSFIAGAVIGFERETHRQPAGLKTHILICVGATLLMLLSIYIPQTYQNFQNGDPGRIAAQVVSGIGFIGAGAILKLGLNVKGLTTAASIWAIAGVGLTIGAGMYLASIVAIAFILVTLIIIEQLEKRFFIPINIKILTVKTLQADLDDEIQIILKKSHFRIIEVNTTYSLHEGHQFHYKIVSSSGMKWVELSKQILKKIEGITGLEIYDPKV